MTDYRELIDQLSLDRADVVVYADFEHDGTLGSVMSEKEYADSDEGHFGAQIAALTAAMNDPDSFAANVDRLNQSIDIFWSTLIDEIRSYFMSIE